MNRSIWIGAIVLLIIGAAASVAAWPWIEARVDVLLDRDRVLNWLSSFGAWAPLFFILLSFIQVVLAPIPGQFIGVAGGYLFGAWAGLLYGFVGATLGAGAAMWLGRRLGRPCLLRLFGEAALARFDRFADRRGPLFFFLVFLFPFVPDDLACYAIGLSRLPIVPMLIMASIVRLPSGVVSVLIGENVVRLSPELLAGLVVGVSVLALLIGRYQARIEARLMRWIARLSAHTDHC
ncbi:MAG TPA: VTT domain-containing protein [Anaerolineae bacterium]|nr:VTT domain-containing protein [Anaerolineae bacterium]